jgi:Tfp pilus assembly protein FimT
MSNKYFIPIALGLIFVSVVAVVVAIAASQGSNNAPDQTTASQTTTAAPSTATPSTQAVAKTGNNQATGDESNDTQCSQYAQTYADSLTKSNNQLFTASPGLQTSYFLKSSHYVAYQGSCYFVLHNETVEQTQQYGRLVSDIYTLYVGGMPTAGMLQAEAQLGTSGFVESPVASCNIQTAPDYSAVLDQSYGTNGSRTSCTYDDPQETQGAGGYDLWLPHYNFPNAPPLSYADFQSLEVKAMAAN